LFSSLPLKSFSFFTVYNKYGIRAYILRFIPGFWSLRFLRVLLCRWQLWASHCCPLFKGNLRQSPSPLWIAILEKLDDKIFLVWNQVEHAPKGRCFHHFVVNPTISMRFLSEDDWDIGCINMPYTNCENQDQLLLHGCSHHLHLQWGRLPWTRWFYFWPFPWTRAFCPPKLPFLFHCWLVVDGLLRTMDKTVTWSCLCRIVL